MKIPDLASRQSCRGCTYIVSVQTGICFEVDDEATVSKKMDVMKGGQTRGYTAAAWSLGTMGALIRSQ